MRERSFTRESFQSEENDAVAMAPSNCSHNDIERFYIEHYSEGAEMSHSVDFSKASVELWLYEICNPRSRVTTTS